MKDKVSSVIVEVADNNCTRGGHILHEQEYNTGHGIPAIPDKICRKIWRQPSQPEIQQEPVVHLLLESTLGWNGGVFGLSVQTAPQPSQSAHRGGDEADSGHAPPQSKSGYGGAVAPAAATGLHPPPGEPVPGNEKAGAVPTQREETGLQAKALPADDLSRTAYPGRCEGGPPPLHCRP